MLTEYIVVSKRQRYVFLSIDDMVLVIVMYMHKMIITSRPAAFACAAKLDTAMLPSFDLSNGLYNSIAC